MYKVCKVIYVTKRDIHIMFVDWMTQLFQPIKDLHYRSYHHILLLLRIPGVTKQMITPLKISKDCTSSAF